MGRGRKLETLEDFQRALKKKYGIGEGSSYKPWLRIQDVKSRGTRSQIYGRKTQRIQHFLSSIESEFFYLAEFSDTVVDIREQFPLIPLNYTQKIAKTLGIKHPKHPKTHEPIIITTDHLLTVSTPDGISYRAISVKPEKESDKARVLEKIDIERVCWELLGVKFSYYTGNELTRIQSQNIDWATAPFRDNPLFFSDEQISYALSEIKSGQSFVEGICERYIAKNIVSHDDALSLVRYLIAEKFIDVDMSYNIPESGILDINSVHMEQRSIANGNP